MKYLIIFTWLLTGCVTTRKLDSKSYPAKPENCKIDILSQVPDRKFEKITVLKTKITEQKDNFASTKKKACLAGGDAIVVIPRKKKGNVLMRFNLLNKKNPVSFTPSPPIPGVNTPMVITPSVPGTNIPLITIPQGSSIISLIIKYTEQEEQNSDSKN